MAYIDNIQSVNLWTGHKLPLIREHTCKRLPQIANGFCFGHIFAGHPEEGFISQAKSIAQRLRFTVNKMGQKYDKMCVIKSF